MLRDWGLGAGGTWRAIVSNAASGGAGHVCNKWGTAKPRGLGCWLARRGLALQPVGHPLWEQGPLGSHNVLVMDARNAAP